MAIAQYNKKVCFYPDFNFGISGGVNYLFSQNITDYIKMRPFGAIGYTQQLSLGYTFSPIMTVRGLFMLNQLNFPDKYSNYSSYPFDYMFISSDIMLNLSNLIEYNNTRPFYVYFFVGAGYASNISSNNKTGITNSNSYLLRSGFQLDFRMSHHVFLNLSPEGNVANSEFCTSPNYPRPHVNVIPALKIGITYHFNDDVYTLIKAGVKK